MSDLKQALATWQSDRDHDNDSVGSRRDWDALRVLIDTIDATPRERVEQWLADHGHGVSAHARRELLKIVGAA